MAVATPSLPPVQEVFLSTFVLISQNRADAKREAFLRVRGIERVRLHADVTMVAG
jgi:hypothetical protein